MDCRSCVAGNNWASHKPEVSLRFSHQIPSGIRCCVFQCEFVYMLGKLLAPASGVCMVDVLS